MGRERFQLACEGRSLAYAPLLWEQLPELVRQDPADWWRDAARGRRLILDAAGIADADAMFVVAAIESRDGGVEELEALGDHPDVRATVGLVECLAGTVPFAVIVALPDAATLEQGFAGAEPEDAEDALSDLARTHLAAGADALAVVGTDPAAVGVSARRAAAVSAFFGRPAFGLSARPGGVETWSDGASGTVLALSESGAWPPADARGIVTTPGDVSGRWDAPALRAIAAARP